MEVHIVRHGVGRAQSKASTMSAVHVAGHVRQNSLQNDLKNVPQSSNGRPEALRHFNEAPWLEISYG
jgi:hypothetical protein